MNSVRAGLFIAPMLFVAACGGDDGNKTTSDASVDAADQQADAAPDTSTAPSFDFTCEGNTAPTTASATITVSGTVEKATTSGLQPVPNATVKACLAGTSCMGQNLKDTKMSDANGNFTFDPIATGSVPVDAYIEMTATNLRTTYTYPASPIVADQSGVPVLTFDPQILSLLAQFGGCTQDDSVNGMVGLQVMDCADTAITDTSNINISVKQNGASVGDLVDLGMATAGFFGDMFAGTYLICNVPENTGTATTEVSGTYKGMQLRPHNVVIIKNTTAATILRPGF